jgi:hypothetical protein
MNSVVTSNKWDILGLVETFTLVYCNDGKRTIDWSNKAHFVHILLTIQCQRVCISALEKTLSKFTCC